MKKITSLLLCLMLVLSMALPAAAFSTGVTMHSGVVTLTLGADAAANARMTVEFDPNYLTYLDYETDFTVHSVREEDGRLEIGLANASSQKLQELMVIRFRVTGAWDQTRISVTTERVDGENGSGTYTSYLYGEGYRFQDVTADQWFYGAVDYMASEGYIQGISQSHFGPALNMNRASFVTLLGRLAGVPKEQVQTQFVDVKANDWFYGAVDYMASEGYIVGISQNQFGPELNMRRADFVTLLGRLEGVEKTYTETRFVDVPAESYYSGYVAWAVEKGITVGVDATHFDPKAYIDRAQMVTFLYRYALSEGMDVTVADPDAVLAQFSDVDSLPGWSVAPFAWAVEQGIIVGMDGKLAPKGTATRAQAAVVLYRYFFEA